MKSGCFSKMFLVLIACMLLMHGQVGGVQASPSTVDWAMFRFNPAHTGTTTETVPAANLALRWSYTTGDTVVSSPAVSGGVVYMGSWDNKVYALNASTGSHIWNYMTGDDIDSSPAVSGGVVYVGSYDNKVYALNALTGSEIWSYTTGLDIYSSPAVSGGSIYIGSTDGKVYAFGPHPVLEFRQDVLNASSNTAWYVLGDYVLHRNDGTQFRSSASKHTPVVAAIATDIFAAEYLMGGSASPQNAVLDTDARYISQGSDFGNATGIVDGPIVLVGGFSVNEAVYYYTFRSNETQIYYDAGAFKRRDTGATITSEASNATKDFFVIESFVDTQGRIVYMFWGRGARGTMAATCFMMEVLMKPSNPYGNTSWFVVRWNEASSGPSVNSFPDAGDTYTVIANGPPL